MTPPTPPRDLYRSLGELSGRLRDVRDPVRAITAALTAARELTDAGAVAFAARAPGEPEARVLHADPRDAAWDLERAARLLDGERLEHVPHELLARVPRRDRPWGVLVVRRAAGHFDRAEFKALQLVAGELEQALRRLDGERTRAVRARIDRKAMQQLAPRDLFYQLLDGLRALTGCDHSAALLAYDPRAGALVLEAEKIMGDGGRSRQIGLRLDVDERALDALRIGAVLGRDLHPDGWFAWHGPFGDALVDRLDYNRDAATAGIEREQAMIVAPLADGRDVLGVLKVAARRAGAFGPWEAALIEDFALVAAIAVRNARHVEGLVTRMLDVERTNALANLARYVSHDVNNGLGATLLTVQQLREEAEAGSLAPARLREDLAHVEAGLQSARRVFGGMMRFARSGATHVGGGRLAKALDTTLDVLGADLGQPGLRFERTIEPGLPALALHQGELEQVLSNLLLNAREALPGGGTVALTARRDGDAVEIVIADDGVGIPAADLERVFEPFFTTRDRGTGLGLPSCRSILWSRGGTIALASAPGAGTRVTVRMPVLAEGGGA